MVLLALLLTLSMMSIALIGAVEWWSIERKREAEAELLYVGDQYRKAIERYYYATPGPIKTLPHTIEELVEDTRFPMPMRHLRRAFVDPVTNQAFEPLHIGNDLNGVTSRSKEKPLKREGFKAPYGAFEGQETYHQWKFVFNPPPRVRSGQKVGGAIQAGARN